MSVSTTYAPLTAARAALAAAITSGESTADLEHARSLLGSLDAAASSYAAAAAAYNASEATYTAAAAAYAAAVADLVTSRGTQIARLDLSARSAEQELVDAGVSGSWSPGTPSSPSNFDTIAARAEVAAAACRTRESLVVIADALSRQMRVIQKLNAQTVQAQYLTAPSVPDTTALDALIAKADRFREYLTNT